MENCAETIALEGDEIGSEMGMMDGIMLVTGDVRCER